MNAPLLAEPVAPEWSARAEAVNGWRGRCLEQFARAEQAVSESLLRWAERPGESVALPHLVGCRFAELQRLLDGVANSAPHARAVAALRAFRAHDPLRKLLCHGTATILADRQGEWHLVLRLLAFRNGEAFRDRCVLSRAEAEAEWKDLQRRSQRLCSYLAVLRES